MSPAGYFRLIAALILVLTVGNQTPQAERRARGSPWATTPRGPRRAAPAARTARRQGFVFACSGSLHSREERPRPGWTHFSTRPRRGQRAGAKRHQKERARSHGRRIWQMWGAYARAARAGRTKKRSKQKKRRKNLDTYSIACYNTILHQYVKIGVLSCA